MKNTFILFITLFALLQSANAGEDATIESSDIIDYVNEIRPHIDERNYVDVSRKFIKQSSVKRMRFGNKKHVLNLNGLSFSGADMSQTKLTLAEMHKTNLKNADFSNSELINVDFDGSDLTGANFSNSDLSSSSFKNVTLTGANFEGANLFQADFEDSFSFIKGDVKKLKSRSVIYVEKESPDIEGEYFPHD